MPWADWLVGRYEVLTGRRRGPGLTGGHYGTRDQLSEPARQIIVVVTGAFHGSVAPSAWIQLGAGTVPASSVSETSPRPGLIREDSRGLQQTSQTV